MSPLLYPDRDRGRPPSYPGTIVKSCMISEPVRNFNCVFPAYDPDNSRERFSAACIANGKATVFGFCSGAPAL